MDDELIFDSILQFVMSPLWKVPVGNFIDNNCVVFDDDEENKFEYTTIHNQFRELIDGLLESRLDELCIPMDRFLEACTNCTESSKEVYKNIMKEILAFDDFITFKKQMVARNLELNLETLKYLGVDQVDSQATPEEPESEEEMLRKAMALSMQSFQEEQEKAKEDPVYREQLIEKTEAELAAAVQEQLQITEQNIETIKETQSVEELKKKETPKETPPEKEKAPEPVAAAPKKPATLAPIKSKGSLPPLKVGGNSLPPVGSTVAPEERDLRLESTVKRQSELKRQQSKLMEDRKAQEEAKKQKAAEQEALKKRSEYLKAQRDRLLAAKKKLGEKEIEEYKKEATPPPVQPKPDEKSKEETDEEEKKKAMRLQFAQRLKADMLEQQGEDDVAKKEKELEDLKALRL